MIRIKESVRAGVIFMVGSLLLLTATLQADPNDDVRLTIRIGDVYAYPGEQQVPIPVYLTNYKDTISFFSLELWKQPGIGAWHHELDTTETLIAGWPAVSLVYLPWLPEIYRIEAEYQTELFGATIGPIYPQQGNTPAFKFYLDAFPISDTTSKRDGLISVRKWPVSERLVSDIHGTVIGLGQMLWSDTNYFACTAWDETNPEECLSWQLVFNPPYDSVAIYYNSRVIIDTNVVKLEPGRFTIVRCGNFDGSADNKINLADITAMIAFVYLNGDEPAVPWAANVDGSTNGAVNLADITKLISHVYLGTGPLSCE